MPLGSVLELVTRTDTKFGNIDAAVANKLDPPIAGGAFDPELIDLSLGQVEYESYAQTGAIAFALDPTKTPAVGSSVAVNITGGGFAATYPSNFVGLDNLISGAILESGVDYTFLFRYAQDWAEVAPSVFEDRVLVVASGLRLVNAGTFDPTSVNLSGPIEYAPYTQTGAVAFALANITRISGSYITVQFTGNGSAITWPDDFAEIQGGDLTSGDYAGFGSVETPESRRLMILWSAAQGKALVALSGEVSGGGGTWGSITGALSAQADLQSALDAKLALTGGTMTGPITLGSGASIVGGDKVASALELKDIAETVVAKGSLTGAISFDYSAGGYQWGTTSGPITSVTITNPPASGKVGSLTLEIVQGGTAQTIDWGAAFRFQGGAGSTLTPLAGAIDIFTLMTRDGGATWLVFEGGHGFVAA